MAYSRSDSPESLLKYREEVDKLVGAHGVSEVVRNPTLAWGIDVRSVKARRAGVVVTSKSHTNEL